VVFTYSIIYKKGESKMNEHEIQKNNNDHNEEIIDIEEFSKKGTPVPKGKKYQIKIDNILYIVNNHEITGRQILELANKRPVEQFHIYQNNMHGQLQIIGYDHTVDFTAPGIELFITIPIEIDPDIVDIEECSKKGHPVLKGKKYRIKIDKAYYEVSVHEMTGRQLLELAKKIPVEQNNLYQKCKNGQSVIIGIDQVVDFTAPGIERFMTQSKSLTEGSK
jgi:hypothetical protein